MTIRFASDRVSPQGVRPEIVLALIIAAPLFAEYKQDCIITSLTDGAHTRTTLHHNGLAVDLRSHQLSRDDKVGLLEDLRDLLPPYYEVYLEDLGGKDEHFHIEYDYKGVASV
jgi:hypothetical protein